LRIINLLIVDLPVPIGELKEEGKRSSMAEGALAPFMHGYRVYLVGHKIRLQGEAELLATP
jgi:hypothetical protein